MTTQKQNPSTNIPTEKLIAHIGHHFNNLFSVIIGGLSLIKDEISPEDWNADLQITYEDILSATHDAASLVTQLNNWAGRQLLEASQTDVNALLQDLNSMLEYSLGGKLQLQLNLHPAPVLAFVDAEALHQNLLHLIANARDAMPESGTLYIQSLPGPCIEIRDQGEGMSADTLRCCTQPFFTTRKSAGKQGLGLAMVAGFARASGGRLEILSTPTTGTLVRLYLLSAEQT